MSFSRISPEQANTLLDATDATVVDIRDPASYAAGHIDGAEHIDGESVETFVQRADHARPLVIYCYHGHSSLNAAQFFVEQGFTEVYSMDGGFEQWRLSHPVTR